MRKAKHGFWDEEFGARVDGVPVPSAEDQFFAEIEEPAEHCTHDDLYAALKRLTTRQNFIIRLHYGIECEPMTLRQIAILMGVHHSTVQEHFQDASQHLENALNPAKITLLEGSTPKK